MIATISKISRTKFHNFKTIIKDVKDFGDEQIRNGVLWDNGKPTQRHHFTSN